MHGFLTDIAIAIIASSLLGLVAHWTKQPIIVAYLLAGVLIGPMIGPTLITNPQTIDTISELGLILLLFIIGLEMNPSSLLQSGRQLAIAGAGQFAITVPLGMLLFAVIGLASSTVELLYLGILCALSSTAIVVKYLYDKFELDTLPGRISLGILIFQDLWAILVLVLQPTLRQPDILPILGAVGKSCALLLLGFLVSRYVLQKVFASIARSPELVVAVAIGWCAAMSGVAGALGVSKEMGALIAGVSMSTFPYSLHVTSKVLPLRDFFLTLFFVSLGMRIPPPDEGTFALVIPIVLFVLVSRFLVVYPLVRWTGGSDRTAFIASVNLSQIGEFSLVIAALGVLEGHLRGELFSAMMYSMAFTSVLAPYAIKENRRLYNLYARLTGKFTAPETSEQPEGSRDCIAILGYHRGAEALVTRLTTVSPALVRRITVIDFNPESLRQLRTAGIRTVFGDISSVDTLAHAGIGDAAVILSTIPDILLRGTTNLELVRVCRQIAPNARIIATADTERQAQRLRDAGAAMVILPYQLTAEFLTDVLRSDTDDRSR